MNTICFECGEPAEHDHHVVPRSLGGSATVPLCLRCHGKVHGRGFGLNHQELTKRGLQKAKARGVSLGKPSHLDPMVRRRICEVRKQGWTLQRIVDALHRDGVATSHGAARWHTSSVRHIAMRGAGE